MLLRWSLSFSMLAAPFNTHDFSCSSRWGSIGGYVEASSLMSMIAHMTPLANHSQLQFHTREENFDSCRLPDRSFKSVVIAICCGHFLLSLLRPIDGHIHAHMIKLSFNKNFGLLMRVKRNPKINSKLNALLLLSSSSIAFNWKSHYASSFLLFIATELFDFVDCWRSWRSPNRRIKAARWDNRSAKTSLWALLMSLDAMRHHGGLACIYEWKKNRWWFKVEVTFRWQQNVTVRPRVGIRHRSVQCNFWGHFNKLLTVNRFIHSTFA